MGCVVRVHHPDLTKEEKKIRVEEIKKALIEFTRSVITENESRYFQHG